MAVASGFSDEDKSTKKFVKNSHYKYSRPNVQGIHVLQRLIINN